MNPSMADQCVFLLAFAILLLPHPATAHPGILPNASRPWLPPNASAAAAAAAAAGPWQAFKNLSGCRPGDNRDGIAKLKNYFRTFGYIANQSSNGNWTDVFDGALEAALKTYQRNFRLNQTGRLDPATVQKILLPRCGVADIINGSNTMNSGGSPPPPSRSSSFHAVGHYTFFNGRPRWEKRALTYAFQPGNQVGDQMKAAFGRAFQRWANVTTLSFSEAEFDFADIRIGFFSGDHGDGEAFDGKLGTLAHAFSPSSGVFHLDSDEDWVVGGGSSGSSSVDVESVAVHEIGHLLGLGHSSEEEAIMYPTIAVGSTKLDLADDDVSGIQELYGSNPNYNGSTGTTATASPESNAVARGGQRWPMIDLVAVAFFFFIL